MFLSPYRRRSCKEKERCGWWVAEVKALVRISQHQRLCQASLVYLASAMMEYLADFRGGIQIPHQTCLFHLHDLTQPEGMGLGVFKGVASGGAEIWSIPAWLWRSTEFGYLMFPSSLTPLSWRSSLSCTCRMRFISCILLGGRWLGYRLHSCPTCRTKPSRKAPQAYVPTTSRWSHESLGFSLCADWDRPVTCPS